MIHAPPSQSRFIPVRGLRYHVCAWGDPAQPWVLLGCGWLDCSASFGPLVAGVLPDYHVLAPDWRGTGFTDWPNDGYWFPDYVADVDALIDALNPPNAMHLVGHSMGAQILSLYAGLRPERARSLTLLDGLFLADRGPDQATQQYRRWLNQLRVDKPQRRYASYAALAERIRAQHPQLSEDWALFVALSWGATDHEGQVKLLADPRHNRAMPTLYRLAESEAIWGEVTCPVCFIDGERSVFRAAQPAGERPRRLGAFRNSARCDVVEVQTAGHMLHWDAPEATAHLIRDFLHSA